MNRPIFYFLALLIIATMSYEIFNYVGHKNTSPFEIITERYEIKDDKNNICIEYPKLIKSGVDWRNINVIIKEKSMINVIDSLDNNLNLKLRAEIMYIDHMILSLKYSGYGYYFGRANGFNIRYAINIDLEKSKLIGFDELFNENIKSKLNKYNFKVNGDANDPLSTNFDIADPNIIEQIFENYYNDQNKSFYFTKNKLWIIVSTPSAQVIYADLYTNYDEISDYISNKSLLEFVFSKCKNHQKNTYAILR